MPRIITLPLTIALLTTAASSGLAASPDPSVPASPVPASPAPSMAPVSPVLDPAAPVFWTRLASEGPPAREDHTLTVDPLGEAAYLFGGRDGRRDLGDLWRLDLATDTWQRLDPAGDRPERRFGHTATWMPGLGLVIFAGQTGPRFHGDLWAFDPVAGAWTALAGGGRAPEARYGTCAVLGVDGRLWISHGFTASGRFGDTRAWDPVTGRWSRETPTEGPTPGERCLHDCIAAPDGRLLLYGGQDNGSRSLRDLWAFDPAAGAWTRAEDPAAGARRMYAAATDGAGGAWLFGGVDARDGLLADLWHWDLVSGAWTPIPPSVDGPAPAARLGAALIADPARGRLLLVGGETRDGRTAEVWQLAAGG